MFVLETEIERTRGRGREREGERAIARRRRRRGEGKKNEHYYNAHLYICLSNSIHQTIPMRTFVSNGVPPLFACVLYDDDDDDGDDDGEGDSICILPLTCFEPGLSCCCCGGGGCCCTLV